MADDGWRPDVLGEHFEQRALPLGDDDEGEVVATLVRFRPPWLGSRPPHGAGPGGAAPGADVLYVHGWSDYFFNRQLARFWSHAGARFYALDLRKYGRSIRPHQTPGYITALSTYDADIAAALAIVRGERWREDPPDRPLILMGHSTGGLILSLWAARHEGAAAALVLNSPWLEFQLNRIGRAAVAPVLGLHARIDPASALPNVDLGYYTRTVSRELEGEWDYLPEWRPARGFAAYPAWLSAIFAGHALIAAGVDVGAPALTLVSARSVLQATWREEMRAADIVLDVEAVAQRALRLGSEVTVARIDGALHDVTLSRQPARAAAYSAIGRWLRGYAPEP